MYRVRTRAAAKRFVSWYQVATNAGQLFSEAFDLITELEIPDGAPSYRAAKWEYVKALASELAKEKEAQPIGLR